ncbi:MAG: NADP-dependent oxidoreductase [Alphaproteobacteria bacterium]|nr:MAG: NADP-dependent oxidoreductase [Alphaproteobacteria bacterium]
MTSSTEIRLKSRPRGMPAPGDFEVARVDVPDPGPGEVQVRNDWMSVDPYMRGRMNDARSYAAPFQLGEVMQGGAVGTVTASNAEGFAEGDIVLSFNGWREAFTAPAQTLRKLDLHGLPPQAFLGVAGMPGLTAYTGLLRIAKLKDGDIVFVSGAAGAVGSLVCQIAKAKGHTVIGSAGGPDKIDFLRDIGVDRPIDYKAESDLTKALLREAPEGIDVYFDNVGGDHLEAALTAARPFGRFALCGMISAYNSTEMPAGPRNLITVVGKNLRLEGFIVSFHQDLEPQFHADLARWVSEGKIKWRETVKEGIEQAPEAFLGLFSGGNIGKMLVKLS